MCSTKPATRERPPQVMQPRAAAAVCAAALAVLAFAALRFEGDLLAALDLLEPIRGVAGDADGGGTAHVQSAAPLPPPSVAQPVHGAAALSQQQQQQQPDGHQDEYNNLTITAKLAWFKPPLSRRTRAPSRSYRIVITTLQIHDGLCNKLLQIFGYYTFVKFRDPNATLVVSGGSTAVFKRMLDMSLLDAYTKSTLVFTDEKLDDDVAVNVNSLWCTFRPSLDVVKYGVRPAKALRDQGEAVIAELRSRGALRVVSVHGRTFEAEGCAGHAGPANHICHTSNRRFRMENALCDFDRVNATRAAAEAWPRAPIADARTGFYLSHDSFAPKPGMNFTELRNYSAMRSTYDCRACLQSARETPMLADMWTSAQADFYLANPASSCEPIVAQWRAALRGPGRPLHQYPADCYSGFEQPQEPSMQRMCAHTNAVALSALRGKGSGVCAQALALAVALERVASGGVFVAWGPWRDLVLTAVDLAALEAAFPALEVSLRPGSALPSCVAASASVRHALDFKPLLLDADAMLAAARSGQQPPRIIASGAMRLASPLRVNASDPDCAALVRRA